jgi:hypothetical protein
MAKLFKSSFDADSSTVANDVRDGFSGYISIEEAKRIASLPTTLSENDMVNERDLIEQRANSNAVYHYSSKWEDQVVRQIKEYAKICNCEVNVVNPDDEGILKLASVKFDDETFSREASATTTQPTIEIDDPFEKDIDTSYLNKVDWEKVVASTKLSSPKTTAGSARVVAISGNERIDVHPHMVTHRGNNNITNPYAIDDLVKDEEQDVGVRLRQANKQKEEARKAEVRASDKLMAQQAQEKGYGAFANQHTIMITESSDGQSGIKPKSALDFNTIPETTAGEQLAEKNASRKESIQRKKSEDERSWDEPNGASRWSISDVFASSLEKHLGITKQ